MIENATLISSRTPPVSDGSGGRTPGTLTMYTPTPRCCVADPERLQIVSIANALQGVTGVMLVLLPVSPQPLVGGSVAYRLDNGTELSGVVLKKIERVHGHQSHLELYLRAA
jgi:hypothetical protein